MRIEQPFQSKQFDQLALRDIFLLREAGAEHICMKCHANAENGGHYAVVLSPTMVEEDRDPVAISETRASRNPVLRIDGAFLRLPSEPAAYVVQTRPAPAIGRLLLFNNSVILSVGFEGENLNVDLKTGLTYRGNLDGAGSIFACDWWSLNRLDGVTEVLLFAYNRTRSR